MIPNRFIDKNGRIRFSYKKKDYEYWKQRGLSHGDSGALLIFIEGNILCYKTFGTIENPCKIMRLLNVEHSEAFDGKMSTPEEICTPPKYNNLETHTVVLDMSNIEPIKLKNPYNGK